MSADSKRAIEALVMVAEEPIEPQMLSQLLELAPTRVEELCAELAAEYAAEGRGYELVRVAGGYRYQSHPDQSVYVERFVLEGQASRLSAAALETLAIIAYKQPVSRAQMAAIRGVNVDGVVRTLQQRGFIAEVGRDPGPGQAGLYGTTRLFLERLGLDSVGDLPPLGQFVPGPEVVEALETGLRPEVDQPDTSVTDDPDNSASVLDGPASEHGDQTDSAETVDGAPATEAEPTATPEAATLAETSEADCAVYPVDSPSPDAGELLPDAAPAFVDTGGSAEEAGNLVPDAAVALADTEGEPGDLLPDGGTVSVETDGRADGADDLVSDDVLAPGETEGEPVDLTASAAAAAVDEPVDRGEAGTPTEPAHVDLRDGGGEDEDQDGDDRFDGSAEARPGLVTPSRSGGALSVSVRLPRDEGPTGRVVERLDPPPPPPQEAGRGKGRPSGSSRPGGGDEQAGAAGTGAPKRLTPWGSNRPDPGNGAGSESGSAGYGR